MCSESDLHDDGIVTPLEIISREQLIALEEAGWEISRPIEFLCDNCGKPMSGHDEMAHCWPERAAHSDGRDDA